MTCFHTEPGIYILAAVTEGLQLTLLIETFVITCWLGTNDGEVRIFYTKFDFMKKTVECPWQ